MEKTTLSNRTAIQDRAMLGELLRNNTELPVYVEVNDSATDETWLADISRFGLDAFIRTEDHFYKKSALSIPATPESMDESVTGLLDDVLGEDVTAAMSEQELFNAFKKIEWTPAIFVEVSDI